jgi:signal transduction histidine kinase
VRTFRLSVRARILSIALIPSVTLLAVGVGVAGFLTIEGFNVRDEAVELRDAAEPANDFARVLQEERRLSMLLLSGDRSVVQRLSATRESLDQLMRSDALVAGQENDLSGGNGDQLETAIAAFAQVRGGVDSGQAPPDQIYGFYNEMVDRILTASRQLARNMQDDGSAADGALSVELFEAAERMSRGNALATVAAGNMTPQRLVEYSRQVGSYQVRLNSVAPILPAEDRARLEALRNSPEWKQLTSMENALLARGVGRGTGSLPVSLPEWQEAAGTVSDELVDLWQSQNTAMIQSTVDSAERTATGWLIAGIAMLLAALLAAVITLRISGGLISRLKRLRSESLELADERLPAIITRLRIGEHVDVDDEIQPLDFGGDEIGQVAQAFNHAESSAVAAAVTEARTREGIKALFLNIAHRSQVVVHRQLELLDQAEHGEEDPKRLEMLFKLDHLATRARRNAENLIILGGEQPGRQWRNPVPLVELVRSAIAETEDYARVQTGNLTTVSIMGNVVADLIHLLAELVENATSFSPPESRVDVQGNVVGRGVAVEVIDQGLGMTAEQMAYHNQILQQPPDFSTTTLSSDSRMGLLVVGQIAARNGVSIRLTESDYGGVRAIVLIPNELIVRSDVRGGDNGAAESYGSVPVEWPTADPGGPTRPAVPQPAYPVAQSAPFEPVVTPREQVAVRREPGSHRRDLANGTRSAEQAPADRPEPPPTQGRPALPRRRRQANLASQLTNPTPTPTASSQPSGTPERSPSQVRDLFSAIESGTRQGRSVRPDPGQMNPEGREGQR